jgi:NAD(P)-dependent dehydrogenase (short-subunit alcohol dehydrogenase family)
MSDRFDLTGKVCVVTGGAAGLGAASARALADHGATVVVLDLSEEAAVASTEGFPTGSAGIGCDVASPEQVESAFSGIGERYGSIDVRSTGEETRPPTN